MAVLDIDENPGVQQNMATNNARYLLFFEGQELCYNYKTGQWSEIPAYNAIPMFSIDDPNADIGLIRFSITGPADLQSQTLTGVPQTAVFTTGAPDINQGGRTFVGGVRPIVNGGTYAVRVGTQDNIDDSVSFSTSTSVNTRSNMANFRSEGRYIRAELTITGGFETANGLDIDFTPAGRV
jgi:hypothetical protein